MAKTKKIATSVAAVATAAALLLGGTFAWQSISQTALNEASDVINPGGRLHDDFNGTNKDVYVENFADEAIFARVRLDEYFEITMNKGTPAENNEIIVGGETTDENGETVKTYETFTGYTSDGTFEAAVDDEGTSWWSWTTGGSTVYMPTFNLNKDSLQADINGTYVGPDGTDGVTEGDDADRYADYVTYTDGEELPGTEIYDADTNDVDEIADGTAVLDENYIEVSATHTAKSTASAELMSMQEWNDAGQPVGDYWVYDTDGWVYYAKPIEGRNDDGTTNATGLLLDGIELNQVMDDSWYYAINVVAQFITADDLGKTDGTGFYDTDQGTVPSANALKLLEKIGVDTSGSVAVSTEAELTAALAAGEDVTIDGTITSSEAKKETSPNFSYDFIMTEGGTLNGGTINSSEDTYATLFINNELGWPNDDNVANDATVNDTTINSASSFGIYAQAIDAPIELNNVTVNATEIGIGAEYAGSTLTLNDVTVETTNQHTDAWRNTAVSAATGANIVINSGTYTGEYAAYVYSSGGSITINGGTFNGKLADDAPEGYDGLVINGGTFTDNPTEFVDTTTHTVTDNGDGTWTVSEKVSGLYTLYLKDTEDNYYDSTPLQGTDGFVTMIHQNVGSTIAVEAGYTAGELPENVTVGLAAYGLAEDGWEEISDVSAETVYTTENNPYAFDAETGILSDASDNAVATISSDMKTITINSVVDNLIVDVYLLKDGQRIESTGSPSDVEKLFNSTYFVVSAGEAEETPVTLTYSVVSPENWDGALARRGETSVTLKVDGDYTADDLEWGLAYEESAVKCIGADNIIENDDGSATITHIGMICGGGGETVRVSLTSDPSVYLDINIDCDTE